MVHGALLLCLEQRGGPDGRRWLLIASVCEREVDKYRMCVYARDMTSHKKTDYW